MKTFQFELWISPEAYLDYYRGTARHVIALSREGLTVQFPAGLLQQFLTPEGILGEFELECDERNHCVGIRRIRHRIPDPHGPG